MNTNRPFPKKLIVESIQFPDSSTLTSASNLTDNVNLKKRLRVEGTTEYDGDVVMKENLEIFKNATVKKNLIVNGSVSATGPIPYVDNQTGWGLSTWTNAGSTYNKNQDSLIAKINMINGLLQTTYATNTYVISMTQIRDYMITHPSGSYPVYSGTGNYSVKVVRPASNTVFLIRDDNNFSSPFKFQRGSVGVGKYLRCADADGTVEWATIQGTIPNLVGINTSTGGTNSAAFSVVDDVGGARGSYFYPNLNSNANYNASIAQGDIAILGGPGSATTGSTSYGFTVGTFNGGQSIRFTSDRTVNSVIQRGETKLSGGGTTAKFTLSSNGVTCDLQANEKFRLFCNPHSTPGNTTQGNVEFVGQSWPMNASTPVLVVTRSNTETPTAKRQSLLINSLAGESHYSPLTEDFDSFIYSAIIDGSLHSRAQQLHVGAWSDYADGISIRQTITPEEANPIATPPITANTNFSGHVRLSACCSTTVTNVSSNNIIYKKRTPATYLIVDRAGIKLKVQNTKKIVLYGATEIQNYTGAILNDPTTDTRNSSLQIGSSTSNVSTSIFGTTKYKYSSLGSTNVQNYILCSSDSDGSMVWRTANDALPSTFNSLTTTTLNIGTNGSNMSQISASTGSTLLFSGNNSEASLNLLSMYPAINTDQSFASSGVTAFTLNKPPLQNDYSVWYVNAPIHVRLKFRFVNNRTSFPDSQSTITTLWVQINTIRINVINTATNTGSFYDINQDSAIDDTWCSSFQLYRFRTLDLINYYQCRSNQSVFEIWLPVLPNFTLPFSSTDSTINYRVDYQIIGKYKYTGNEALTMTSECTLLLNAAALADNNNAYYLRATGVVGTSGHTNEPTTVNIILFGDVRQGATYGEFNTGTINANYKTGPSYVREYHVKRLSEIGDSFHLITMGNVSITNCHIRNHLFVPGGFLYSCGLAGRRGVMTINDTINPVGRRQSRDSYSSWGSIFNFYWTRQGTIETWVDSTRVLTTTANWSDYRIKTNFSAVDPVLNRLCEIPLYRFDTIAYKSMPAIKNKIGFLAHEVQTLFPDIPNLIQNEKDAIDPTTNEFLLQTFNEKELIMLLLKGLQEAREEINVLKQEIVQIKTQLIL